MPNLKNAALIALLEHSTVAAAAKASGISQPPEDPPRVPPGLAVVEDRPAEEPTEVTVTFSGSHLDN